MTSFPVQRFRIPAAHPCLAGHFPGNPVVPGVLLLDRAIEAAEALAGLAPGALRLPQVKFLRPLLPEQEAELWLERLDDGRLRFRIECAGALLASGELAPDA